MSGDCHTKGDFSTIAEISVGTGRKSRPVGKGTPYWKGRGEAWPENFFSGERERLPDSGPQWGKKKPTSVSSKVLIVKKRNTK